MAALALVVGAGVAGCNNDALPVRKADAGAPGGLTDKQAAAVLAKVGDKTITLGDFAATLERMGQFDRLRYQSKKKRRKLLDEMIDLELLAQEARRRGLHNDPEVQNAIGQILRDALLAQARDTLPPPAEIPIADVRAYYESNKDRFQEPERRRVSVVIMDDRAKADAALALAREITTGKAWGELYQEHSVNAPKKGSPAGPADLAGDLGIVGAPGDAKGDNAKVPAAVRKVLFALAKVGDIHPELAEEGGRFYIVRLSGMSKGHTRTLEEADRTIRVAILKRMLKDKERELEADLRQRFPVKIDPAGLKAVELPKTLKDYKPFWDSPGSASASAASSAAPPPPPSAAPPPAPSVAPSASAAPDG